MAIAYVDWLGNAAAKTTSASFTCANSVSAGDLVVIYASSWCTTLNAPTDSQSNTYTQAATATNAAGSLLIGVWYSVITASLSTTDTISVTTTGGAATAVAASHHSGLPSPTVDGTSAAGSGSSTALASGSTATTTNSSDLLLGLGAERQPNTVTLTPLGTSPGTGGGTWSRRITNTGTSGGPASNNIVMYPMDDDTGTTATGTFNTAGTLSTTGIWAALCVAINPGAAGAAQIWQPPAIRKLQAVQQASTW